MNRFNIFLLTLGFLSLSACTTSPFGLAEYSRVNALAYYQWVMQAQAISLEQEHARFASIPVESASAINLVQQAILISAGGEPSSESDLQAIALLERADRKSLNDEYNTFVMLWLEILNARQLARSEQELIQLLEQERVTLQSQIDALTSIEQQLNNRESLQNQ